MIGEHGSSADDLSKALVQITRKYVRTLAHIARWDREHGAEGLINRLADDGIDVPSTDSLHGQWCTCVDCRPDDEWGPPGRMVTN